MFINFSRSFVDFVSIATSHERGDRMRIKIHPIWWWNFFYFLLSRRKTLSRHSKGNEILIVQLTLYFPFFVGQLSFSLLWLLFFFLDESFFINFHIELGNVDECWEDLKRGNGLKVKLTSMLCVKIRWIFMKHVSFWIYELFIKWERNHLNLTIKNKNWKQIEYFLNVLQS